MKFVSDGFRAVQKGQQIGDMVIDHISDAANIFGDRLARRHGKKHRAIVRQDSWTNSSAMFQVTIVAPSGTVETEEWMHIAAV